MRTPSHALRFPGSGLFATALIGLRGRRAAPERASALDDAGFAPWSYTDRGTIYAGDLLALLLEDPRAVGYAPPRRRPRVTWLGEAVGDCRRQGAAGAA